MNEMIRDYFDEIRQNCVANQSDFVSHTSTTSKFFENV